MSRRKRRLSLASETAHSEESPAILAQSRRVISALVAAATLIVVGAGIWWASLHNGSVQAAVVPAHDTANAKFVGSEACAGCHDNAYAAWKTSQHARAMQHASADTVLGDFNQAKFRYAGIESTFFQRDGKFFVRTDGADGKLADFEIKYTFGITPLQQYLIAFPDGRMQALSIAWDSRPKEQGGQRWFHLYPKEKVDHRDELHWTRRMQNWNFMCADCHSTDVKKNYDSATDTYNTTWNEISVGCEACHGPGSAHIAWARTKAADATKGLTVALTERAGVRWTEDTRTGNVARSVPREKGTEIDVCAQCHSRRSQIAENYHAGQPFQDFYRPLLLSPGLYYPDGQQRDEVYNWGSFLQSRMYHSGVTCSDCHEPHGQKLRAQGNAVCANCHQATKYDSQVHHHHVGNGAGTRCVDCHMSATNYMVVDPRHDHSMRVPRPDLTVTQGTPNVCNGCHGKKNADWKAETLERWYGHRPQGYQNYAGEFAFDERGAAEAGPSLARLAVESSQPAIVRATALEALADHPARATVDAARAGLTDSDTLVRRAGVGTLALLPPAQRLPLVAPLLDDSIRTVRMEAVYSLADALQAATPVQRTSFDRAAAEYEAAQRYNFDRPEARAALGNFFARQGRFDEAKVQLKSSIKLDPEFVPAYVNLADLLRAQALDADSERVLRDGLKHAPRSAALHHALGLALIRQGHNAQALVELQRAAKLAPSDTRFAYVYAVGLHSAGKMQAAITEIDRALAHHPDDRDLLVAAATFRQEKGDVANARRFGRRLFERYPDDPNAALFARQLGALRDPEAK
ncbi:MAG: tetratricopeptide repeat protein [Gallionella sp.]